LQYFLHFYRSFWGRPAWLCGRALSPGVRGWLWYSVLRSAARPAASPQWASVQEKRDFCFAMAAFRTHGRFP